MATVKTWNNSSLRTHNAVKGAGLLLIIVLIGAALLLVPALRKAPATASPVNLPAMSNVPPAGSFHVAPGSAAQ